MPRDLAVDSTDASIWSRHWDLSELQALTANTLVSHLGIEFTAIEPRSLCARMLVTKATSQRLGYLHGGASLALAETVGSIASQMCIDRDLSASVGLDINANHVRGVPQGDFVYAIAEPMHLGRTTHVWSVRINNAVEQLVCIARLTTSVISLSKKN